MRTWRAWVHHADGTKIERTISTDDEVTAAEWANQLWWNVNWGEAVEVEEDLVGPAQALWDEWTSSRWYGRRQRVRGA